MTDISNPPSPSVEEPDDFIGCKVTIKEEFDDDFDKDFDDEITSSDPSYKAKKKPPKETKPCVCNMCPKSFKNKRDLERHKRTHTGEKPFSCDECEMSFAQEATLRNHKMIHSGEKPYTCTECKKCFARKSYLDQHMRTHTGERPHSCDVCNKSFVLKKDLISHVRALHTGDRPFSCTVCGKCFVQKQCLRTHERMHSGEKPYSCKVCGKRFSQGSNLARHSVLHTGKKPFCCDTCGKCFATRQNLQMHERLHTGERPFACNFCDKRFPNPGNLRKHKLCNHKDQIPNAALLKGKQQRKRKLKVPISSEWQLDDPSLQEDVNDGVQDDRDLFLESRVDSSALHQLQQEQHNFKSSPSQNSNYYVCIKEIGSNGEASTTQNLSQNDHLVTKSDFVLAEGPKLGSFLNNERSIERTRALVLPKPGFSISGLHPDTIIFSSFAGDLCMTCDLKSGDHQENHRLSDRPRIFLLGDEHGPPSVGGDNEQQLPSALRGDCVPSVRIQGANFDQLQAFINFQRKEGLTILPGSLGIVMLTTHLCRVGQDRFWKELQDFILWAATFHLTVLPCLPPFPPGYKHKHLISIHQFYAHLQACHLGSNAQSNGQNPMYPSGNTSLLPPSYQAGNMRMSLWQPLHHTAKEMRVSSIDMGTPPIFVDDLGASVDCGDTFFAGIEHLTATPLHVHGVFLKYLFQSIEKLLPLIVPNKDRPIVPSMEAIQAALIPKYSSSTMGKYSEIIRKSEYPGGGQSHSIFDDMSESLMKAKVEVL